VPVGREGRKGALVLTILLDENILGTNSQTMAGYQRMSDEAGSSARTESVHHEHWCEHSGCKKWGSFGFATRKAEPRWFCMEHRPEWKPKHA
jgi:hypothetical protein